MEFVNSQLPECISFGAQADAMWSTNIVALTSGRESSNQNWQDCRHVYDISYGVRSPSDYNAIRVHFHTMRGRAKKFPFKDPIDNAATQAEGALLENDESPSQWQMFKRYGDYDRKITRPVAGLTVYRTRTGVTTTITPTINYSTGLATISGHANGDTYNWAGSFLVPCRYDTDRLPALIVDRETDLLVRCDSIPLVEVRE
jgi:uncharacterized protein (TIGR02217 family)